MSSTVTTKQDLVDAGKEIEERLSRSRTPSGEDANRLEQLSSRFGHVPAIDRIFKDDYDRKMTHSGFGSPDCRCHISPPCGNCIEYTSHCQTCGEELLEDEVDLGKPPICRPCLSNKSIPTKPL